MRLTSLSDIAEVCAGQPAPQNENFFSEIGYPFIRAGSLEQLLNGSGTKPLEHITESVGNRLKMRLFPKNTILFAKSGMSAKIGRIFSLKKDAYVVSHLAAIIPKHNVDAGYLEKWFIKNPPSRLIPNDSYPSIRLSEIAQLKVPLPPLEEQKRIAVILDKADAIRRKRKEAIALTEELLRSTFLDMFGDPVTNPKGWEVKPLREIATFLGGGTPSRKQLHFYKGNICWASSKDMNVDVLVDTEEHITQEAIDNSSTKLVNIGVLLVVVKSKILMRRLPVARTEVPTCFNQDIKAIVPRDISFTRYLHRHLKIGQGALLRQARGVNTEGLTLDHLRNYKVMTPPTQRIYQFIELEKSLERSLQTSDKADKESDNLFNSLLKNVFLERL